MGWKKKNGCKKFHKENKNLTKIWAYEWNKSEENPNEATKKDHSECK